MERFIEIALDTVAGEGVDIQDRLIDLSELCARFSPLLYHLDDLNRPIASILELFRQTWESLKTYDDPLILVVSYKIFLNIILRITAIHRKHVHLTLHGIDLLGNYREQNRELLNNFKILIKLENTLLKPKNVLVV